MHLNVVSDHEEVASNPNLELGEDQDKEIMFRVLSRAHSKPPIKVTPYDGKLDINIVLDWISDIEKFSEYKNTSNNRKVNIVVTKLKGHTSLWWEHFQIDRQRKGKKKKRTWENMMNKIKKRFLLVDYQVNLLRKIQNLKQKDMSVNDYTKEFYRLHIRSRHVDDEIEKVARYLNGLRFGMQDEIIFVKLNSVEEANQYALKSKEILAKRYEQRQRGRCGRF